MPITIDTTATVGIVKPIHAIADPMPRFKLVCNRLRAAARTAAPVSGSSTSIAIAMPTTAIKLIASYPKLVSAVFREGGEA